MKFRIPPELIILAGQHAAKRGITLEEYIEEDKEIVEIRGAEGLNYKIEEL